MQQYYRVGVLENCSEKWNVLWDCLYFKNQVLFSTLERNGATLAGIGLGES
ncbi:hypothetical protein CRYUN_Cryun41cG0044300 [Craigia yunnanensis]